MTNQDTGVASRTEQSAGGVVVRRIEGDWHALVIKDPYGNWGLPKGHVEGGESLAEAARREVAEETGLRPDTVGPTIETIDWTFRREGEVVHKFCTLFLMLSAQGEAVPELSEGISECQWLPLETAPERIVYANTRQVVVRARAMLEAVRW